MLFTDGEPEAQNAPGWASRSLALCLYWAHQTWYLILRGCGFLYFVSPRSTGSYQGVLGPPRINSVQEPQEKVCKVKF